MQIHIVPTDLAQNFECCKKCIIEKIQWLVLVERISNRFCCIKATMGGASLYE